MDPLDNFETENVITMVQKSRCLWDPTHPDFKVAKVKNQHWNSIALEIIPNFINFTSTMKMRAVLKVQKRWKNARSEYKKTLMSRKRTKYGFYAFERKKYLYYDLIKFLYPHMGVDIEDMPEGDDNMIDLPGTIPIKEGYNEGRFHYHLLEILKESSKTVQDDDYAFFKCILPMVGKLNSSDKLNFRKNIIYRFKEIFQNYTPIKEKNILEEIPLIIKLNIIEDYDKGLEISELADEYNVFTSVISEIIDDRVYYESLQIDDYEKVITGKDLFARLEEFILNMLNKTYTKPFEIYEKTIKFYEDLKTNTPNIYLTKSFRDFKITEQWVKDFIYKRGKIEDYFPVRKSIKMEVDEVPHNNISSIVTLEISDDDEDVKNDSLFESFDHPLPGLDMYGTYVKPDLNSDSD